MDYADAATSDTMASASQLGSERNGQFSEKSRLLRDERGQMVQLPQLWSTV
jgi:serine/threonine protein kinase